MHNLIYGGINSGDYKAYITNAGIYKSPEKRYKKHTIPGRNGDLLEDTGTFENVEVEYPLCVYEGSDSNLQAFLAAMLGKKGYQRIEDTFHPEYYRMGAFLDEYEPKRVTVDAEMSSGVIKFDCMPQKFLKSGDNPICLIEGNWYNYVSSEDEPDIPSLAGMTAGYIKAPDDRVINISLHNERDDALVLIYSIDSNDSETEIFFSQEYERNLPAGDYNEIITLPQGSVKWRFYYQVNGRTIGEVVTLGNAHAEFIFEATYYGEKRNITAHLAKTLEITNPTGFPTKPLVEYFAYYNSNIKITNATGGIDKDFYELAFNVENENNRHIYLDCDQQYAYNDEGENVSNIMSIITAESSDGKSLVFPEFGSDVIKVEFLHEAESMIETTHNTLIFIYPRWWTV